MHVKALWCAALGAAVGLAACAPAQVGQRADGGAVSVKPKTMVFVVPQEPGPLISTIGGVDRRVSEDLANAVHQHLANYDDRGDVHPMLATELPSVAAGTWTVRPDGTMQTTYRLRPNVLWHDGTLLTAKDVIFAWTVTKDLDGGMAERGIAALINRIEAQDDLTLVMDWTRSYPFANAIVEEDLGPYPVHILEALYQADKERFRTSQYWTTQFIGVGPFQLTEWELGSHLVLKAFDRFYRGRAKIDTITVRFIPDDSTVVSNLLAGAVDAANPNALTFQQAWHVKEEWEGAGKKPLGIIQTTHWRMVHVAFRNPALPEILDPRVRRGLLHGLDRRAMADVLFFGQAPVSDAFIPPSDVKWEWVKDVAATYPYDRGRAQQLLAEAGWRRGSEGTLADPNGRRVSFPIWGERGSEEEMALMADYWKALGADVEQVALTAGQSRDGRFRATMSGLYPSLASIKFLNLLTRLLAVNCPTEDNRYLGFNAGCYSNPTMESIVASLVVAIEPGEQRRLYRDLIKLQTEDLPVLPLYFWVRMTLFREGVVGAKGDTVPRTGVMWNVAEWDLR